MASLHLSFIFFFFNDTATTEIYTLSLHDALPISRAASSPRPPDRSARALRRLGRCTSWSGSDALARCALRSGASARPPLRLPWRSEEHTSELQSQSNLVCRLLLEKKKKKATCCISPLGTPIHRSFTRL